jgi:hypothetical protein
MAANFALPGENLFKGKAGSFAPSTSDLLERALGSHWLDSHPLTRYFKRDLVAWANTQRLSDLTL